MRKVTRMSREERNEQKRLRDKKRRARYRAEGRCTECGKQDERTKSGKSTCQACVEKYRVYNLTIRHKIGRTRPLVSSYIIAEFGEGV